MRKERENKGGRALALWVRRSYFKGVMVHNAPVTHFVLKKMTEKVCLIALIMYNPLNV